MTVSMEVGDIGRIHAHVLQHSLERRPPVGALLHALHSVGQMPMRGQGDVSLDLRELIRVRITRYFIEQRLRFTDSPSLRRLSQNFTKRLSMCLGHAANPS